MKIKLLDFLGKETFVEIPNDIDKIIIDVVSGDMVMTYPFYKDSSNCRSMDSFDGVYIIPKKNFQKLNQMPGKWTCKMLEQLTK